MLPKQAKVFECSSVNISDNQVFMLERLAI